MDFFLENIRDIRFLGENKLFIIEYLIGKVILNL